MEASRYAPGLSNVLANNATSTMSQAAMRKVLEQPVLLHRALIKNDKHVPAFKAPICTHKFLLEARENNVFLFSQDDVRYKVIAEPPALIELNVMVINSLQRALLAKNPKLLRLPNAEKSVPRLLQHLGLRQADKKYCMEMLATLHHMGVGVPIFRKNYVPPVRGRAKPEKEERMVQNDDDFFDGLPELTAKQLKSRGRALTSKPERIALQVAQMEARRQKLDTDLTSKRRDLQKAEDERAEENCYRRLPKKRTASEAAFNSPRRYVADNGKRMKTSHDDSGSKDAAEQLRVMALTEAAAASFEQFVQERAILQLELEGKTGQIPGIVDEESAFG